MEKATIRVDDDDPKTEPWTKGLKFDKGAPDQQGDIVVDAQQDQQNPRKVTLTLKKAPKQSGGGSGGDQGGRSESGSGGQSGDQQSSGGSQQSNQNSGGQA